MKKLEDLSYILPASLTGNKIKYILFGVIGILAGICLILVIVLAMHVGGAMSPSMAAMRSYDGTGFKFLPLDNDACATVPCLEVSARIVENQDYSVDPCDNFYKHACGAWEKRHTIPSDQYEITVSGLLDQKGRQRLVDLLEAPIIKTTPSSYERKLKQFYANCLHDYGRMKDAGKPLLDIIARDIKGWYVLDPDNWSSRGWNLQTALATVIGQYNTRALVQLRTAWNVQTRAGFIYIMYGGLGMYYTFFQRDDKAGTLEAYKDYMRDVADLLMRDANLTLDGAERDSRIEQFVDDAFGQEEKISQMLMAARNEQGYRSFWRTGYATVAEIERNFTQIRWRQILAKAYDGYPVSDNTRVALHPISYLSMIDEMLRNESDSKDRIMNNYLVWMLASAYAGHLSWEYRHARYTYLQERYGVREVPSTEDRCLTDTNNVLKSAVAAEYLRTHVGLKSFNEGEQMLQNIKQSLVDQIQQIDWMDATTKGRAKTKMQAVNDTMGIGTMHFDGDYWDNTHSMLVIDKDNGYFINYLNANKFAHFVRSQQMKDGGHYQGWKFSTGPSIIGSHPYYTFLSNLVIIPTTVLDFPLFTTHGPKFLNYAGLGSLIGEEMLEAISEYGRYYWTNGSRWDWWTVDTYADFTKAQNCFAKYLDGRTVGPFLIDGEQKTAEIKGRFQTRKATETVGGIRAGLGAYTRWVGANGGEPKPLGLKNYTIEQAFFLSVAQARCYIRTPEAAYRYVASSNKIPEDVLLNAALSHMPEFATAFNCPVSSNMVTDNTCKVF